MAKKNSVERDVFISYRSTNEVEATAIRDELERNGLSCWMASRDIPPSSNFAEEIVKALKPAVLTVLVYSKDVQDSVHVVNEVKESFDMGKPIIPFKLDDSFPEGELQFCLNNKQWIDATLKPDYKDSFGELVETAKRLYDEEMNKRKRDLKIPVIIAAALIIIAVVGFMAFNGSGDTTVVNTTDSSNITVDFIELVSDGSGGYAYSAIGSIPDGLSNSSKDVVHADFYDESGKVIKSDDTKVGKLDGNILGSALTSKDNIVKVSVELQDSKGNVISSAESSDIEKYE